MQKKIKQGRIHGNPVADGWAGAVMRKLLAILEIFRTDGRTDRRTDGPTDRQTDMARCRVACPRLKIDRISQTVTFSRPKALFLP